MVCPSSLSLSREKTSGGVGAISGLFHLAGSQIKPRPTLQQGTSTTTGIQNKINGRDLLLQKVSGGFLGKLQYFNAYTGS